MDNLELSDVCFEQIKDDYHYGLFGDFKLVIDKATGYFNATKLCEQGKKNLFHWQRLEKSRRLMEYYGLKFETYERSRPPDLEACFYEYKGINNTIDKQITGVYVPICT